MDKEHVQDTTELLLKVMEGAKALPDREFRDVMNRTLGMIDGIDYRLQARKETEEQPA